MAKVSTRTANWRLFGGGGLLVGGLLWTLDSVLGLAGVTSLGPWVYGVALIVIAVALGFVAFGETGSNGAVGKDLLGRLALVVFALGFLLTAVNALASLGVFVGGIAALLLVVGGLVSADAIYHNSVAKGAAQWFLFLPAIALVLLVLQIPALVPLLSVAWLGLIIAVLLLITGALYLFNDRKRG